MQFPLVFAHIETYILVCRSQTEENMSLSVAKTGEGESKREKERIKYMYIKEGE